MLATEQTAVQTILPISFGNNCYCSPPSIGEIVVYNLAAIKKEGVQKIEFNLLLDCVALYQSLALGEGKSVTLLPKTQNERIVP